MRGFSNIKLKNLCVCEHPSASSDRPANRRTTSLLGRFSLRSLKHGIKGYATSPTLLQIVGSRILRDTNDTRVSHRIAVDLWGCKGETQVKTVTKHEHGFGDQSCLANTTPEE